MFSPWPRTTPLPREPKAASPPKHVKMPEMVIPENSLPAVATAGTTLCRVAREAIPPREQGLRPAN